MEDFVKVLKGGMIAQQRFIEWQREAANLTETERQRLIMRILAELEDQGIAGITLTDLAGHYNAIALRRHKVGESTLSVEVNTLCNEFHYLRKEPHPTDRRKALIFITQQGRSYLRHTESLQRERLDIYMNAFSDPEKQEVVREFFLKVTEAFNQRMNSWRLRFGG